MTLNPVHTILDYHATQYPTSSPVRLFSCPGRINIIGEHIDYSGGHVLPAAIDRAVYICISPNTAGEFRFSDCLFNKQTAVNIDSFYSSRDTLPKIWIYPYGAIALLGKDWRSGYDISFYSTIPSGGGMSSSAAITVGTMYAVSSMTGNMPDATTLARLGQRVEKDFAGVACGIMDQFAVINGKKNSAMFLDTRDLSFDYCAIDPGIHFVLINSGIKHSLRDSSYNERRSECESALEKARRAGASAEHLCELQPAELETVKAKLTGNEYRRAYHAVTENARTIDFVNIIRRGDYAAAGVLLYASHESLRDCYDVSIPEIDDMVEWTRGMEGVYGSRMMGGGFGGCTINMVSKNSVDAFTEDISKKYLSRFGRRPDIYDCSISDGVRELPAQR